MSWSDVLPRGLTSKPGYQAPSRVLLAACFVLKTEAWSSVEMPANGIMPKEVLVQSSRSMQCSGVERLESVSQSDMFGELCKVELALYSTK
jgi:hypothetical protein